MRVELYGCDWQGESFILFYFMSGSLRQYGAGLEILWPGSIPSPPVGVSLALS